MKNFVFVCLMSLPMAALAQPGESLRIGPGDQIHVTVVDSPELDQHPRVTDAGEVPLLGVGAVKVAGLTPGEAATAVHDKLVAAHYMNHPEVGVAVEQYATQTVAILGQVRSSGAYPIVTGRPVLDVLALAGGLTPAADRNILIERRGDQEHPVHYNVSNDGAAAVRTSVMVYPGDTILVPKAGIVYILGDVNRPGGIVMDNNSSEMTLLQALAMAGGVARTAKEGHAKLLRKDAAGYKETQLSLGDIQNGKQQDIALAAGDVLYVPFSYAKNVAVSGSSGVISSLSSVAIYTMP
ncbi:MAG: Capsule polysaccharide export protein [Acidobacteriaceae bacterium]|jgi:polysaccharide export outer membrane protein|nr:Capsule polysaccharide export protein [Acidobacteriaceae bacterium]